MADVDFASVGTSAASGAAMGSVAGPYGAAAGAIIAAGLSLFGSYEKSQAAKAMTQDQQNMIQTEMQQEQLRNEIMHLSSQREGMQIVRNAQRARSLAEANAVQSGAQFGSALPGGYGQIAGASGTEALKISQDTMAGDTMFGLNEKLSMQKIAYAQHGGDLNTAQGYQSLGQAIGQAQGPLTNLASYGYGKATSVIGQSYYDNNIKGAFSFGSPSA